MRLDPSKKKMRLDFDPVVGKFPHVINSAIWTLDGFWALY